MTLIVAACDKPEAKPPTNIEKDEKADTDVVPKGKSGNGSSGETDTDGAKSGEGGEEAPSPALYSFAFDDVEEGVKVAFTAGTYTKAVVETNKPAGDVRAVEYTSSENAIATVNGAGVVTFVTQGTVTITATKALKGEYPEATARYILYITTNPATKAALVTEIKRATEVHGNTVDLNYIDTSAITDMSWLFSSDTTDGHELGEFNGDISKWDVAAVTNMEAMFFDAKSFNQDISGWNVARVNSMNSMFGGATSFNQDISDWNVSKVTNMKSMFNGATSFNQDISRWNVARVTDMFQMFLNAAKFNQDISGWNVARVTDMKFMFFGATSFNKNIDAWGPRIHNAIKTHSWLLGATNMFKGSGLANKLPSWCSTTACKDRQS